MAAFQHAGCYPPDDWPNQHNKITPFASIGIYTDQAATTLATLYADRDRAAPAANPITLDGNGNNPMFFAEPDTYFAARITNGIPGVTVKIAVDVDPEDAIDETGLMDLRGSYDASTNLFPATGGSGAAGAVLKGDTWIISVAGTLGGAAVGVGDQIFALTDTPGQTAANWQIIEHNIGYTPANDALVVHKAGTETVTGAKDFTLNTKFGNGPFIDPRSAAYGVLNDGTQADVIRFKAAVAAAVAAGLPLLIPFGTLTLDLTATHPSIPVSGDLTVFGFSRFGSKLHIGPTNAAFTKLGFDVAGGKKLQLMNFTLEGPASRTQSLATDTIHDQAITYSGVATDGGEVRLHNMEMAGVFEQAIACQDNPFGGGGTGSLLVEVVNSHLRAQFCTIAGFVAHESTSARIHVRDTELELVAGGDSHWCYIHPNVSYAFANVNFTGTATDQSANGAYGIHHFGSADEINDQPYAYIDNCHFESSTSPTGRGVLTGKNVQTLITRSTFRNMVISINCQGSTTIDDCDIYVNKANSTGIARFGERDTPRTIATPNTRIYGSGTGICLISDTGTTTLPGAWIWDLSGLRAYALAGSTQGAGTDAMMSLLGATSPLKTDGAVFDCQSAAGFQFILNVGAATGITKRINRAIFKGTPTIGGITDQSASTGIIEVNDCDFSEVTTGRSLRPSGSGGNRSWVGRNNNFGPTSPRQNTNTYYQAFTLRPGWNTADVVAANDLLLSANAQNTRITGTTAINNIYVSTNTAGGYNLFHGATIRLAHLAAGTTTAAGNLVPKTVAARTVNSVSEWLYDAIAAKWYEVGS